MDTADGDHRASRSYWLVARAQRRGANDMMHRSVEKDQLACSERKLPTALVKRSIATVFAALLASVVAPSVWGPVNAEVITDYPFRDSFARHYQVEKSPRIVIGGGIS